MGSLFLYCAVIGGTILVAQFLMLLFGFGGDTDIEHATGGDHQVGHDQGAFLKLFSLQTVSTFLTFFGLVGLGTLELGWSPLSVAAAAGAAGCAALFFVGKLMRSLSRLQSVLASALAAAVLQAGSRSNPWGKIPPTP